MWTICVLTWLVRLTMAVGTMNPDFDDQVVNVTVIEKMTAILPCSVINLGNHKIVWTDQYSTLLTYEDRRIIDDERLSIERPYHRDWNLHIRDARYSDQGVYNCQINTEPIKIKLVNLHVKVPSKIVEGMSTRNVTIKEGDKVTLVCNATGVPQPKVTWFRLVKNDKGEEKQSELCPDSKKVGVDGEVLVIHNVSRYCGGSYECVAFNGVQPAATRVIDVSVKFPPEVYLPTKRIGQSLGKDTILECTITAHPMSDVWWERRGEKISSQDLKYRVEIYDETNGRLTLSLRIFSLEISDFGVYTCYASNQIGTDEEQMVLYDYTKQLRTTTTSPAPTTTVYYLPRKSSYGDHRYNHGVGMQHVTKGRHHDGYNKIPGGLHYGENEDRGQGRSQGRNHGSRPGPLTGSRGSDGQIYTPTYRKGDRGKTGTSRTKMGDGNRSNQMYPNCQMLISIVSVLSSSLLRISPLLHL